MPRDILDVYDKKSRERLAYHGFIKEAIVDTLNDNNEQAFCQLDKVVFFIVDSLHVTLPGLSMYSILLYSMSTAGVLTRP